MQPDSFEESVRALIKKMDRYGTVSHWPEFKRVRALITEKTLVDLGLIEVDPNVVKSCPFCGCDAVVVEDNWDFWVQCDEGHTEGSLHKTPAEAIAEWNRREGV